MKPGLFFSTCLAAWLLANKPLSARTEPDSSEAVPEPATASLYQIVLGHGTYTETTFGQIHTQGKTDYRPSWITFLALNRKLDGRLRALHFEAETQYVQHSGIQKHPEVVGALIARWPFSSFFPTSMGLGAGASYAAGHPELEFPNKFPFVPHQRESRRLLNYLVTEMDVGWPGRDERLLLRIHHRSGIYGTYCLPVCGSNFVSYGIKTTLD